VICLTLFLDRIRVGSWQLVNMGILYRDISAGNVLVLCPHQQFARREQGEHCAQGSESLAELKRLLPEIPM
jgi:hypothetical protein